MPLMLRFSLVFSLLALSVSISFSNDTEALEKISVKSSPRNAALISEDFEYGGWSERFWVRNWCNFRYSCQVVASPDGSGRAFRAVFRRADRIIGDRKTMGDELATRESIEFDEQWIGLKIYFSDKEFGKDARPVILVQQHDVPDRHLGESDRSPVFSIVYFGGALFADFKGSIEALTPRVGSAWQYSGRGSIELGTPRLDSWNYIVIHIRWDSVGSKGSSFSGLLDVWLNGTRFSRSGINIGFNDLRRPRLKFGMYYYEHDSDFDERVAYFDDIRIVGGSNRSYCDVAPSDAPIPRDANC
jgi:hypothetical protein